MTYATKEKSAELYKELMEAAVDKKLIKVISVEGGHSDAHAARQFTKKPGIMDEIVKFLKEQIDPEPKEEKKTESSKNEQEKKLIESTIKLMKGYITKLFTWKSRNGGTWEKLPAGNIKDNARKLYLIVSFNSRFDFIIENKGRSNFYLKAWDKRTRRDVIILDANKRVIKKPK